MSPSSSSRPHYQYQPLPSPDHIRLLVLQPETEPAAPLHCALLAVPLSAVAGRFEAISYVWGEQGFTATLQIWTGPAALDKAITTDSYAAVLDEAIPTAESAVHHYTTLRITPNLAAALRRFRLADRPRALWADAVCIQQADNVEKAQQVGRMGAIYAASARTLAWLGEVTPRWSGRAFAYCKALASLRDGFGLADPDVRRGKARHFQRDVQARRDGLFRNGMSQLLLWVLLWRPWFRRLWCVQEIVLPQAALLCWGQDTLDWEIFQLVVDLIHQVAEDLDMDPRWSTSWMAWGFVAPPSTGEGPRQPGGRGPACWWQPFLMTNARAGFHGTDADLQDLQDRAGVEAYADGVTDAGGRRETLLRLTTLFASFGCKDPRDRLFALLGICIPTPIWPDYATAYEVVVRNAAASLLHAGDFHQLHYLRTVTAPATDSGHPLPSYATFLALDDRYPLPFGGKNPRMFRAGTRLPPQIGPAPSLAGYTIDVVTEIICNDGGNTHFKSSSTVAYLSVPQTAMWLFRIVVALYKVVGKQYRTGASVAAAVGRTLCLNGAYPDTRMFERIPNFYDEAFDAIVAALQDPAFLPAIDSTAATDTEAARGILQHASEAEITPEAHKTILWRVFREVLLKVAGVTSGRDAAVTKEGFVALVPNGVVEGDQIVVFAGAETPFVVRRKGKKWALVGDCYVEGLMEGEGLVMKRIRREVFELV